MDAAAALPAVPEPPAVAAPGEVTRPGEVSAPVVLRVEVAGTTLSAKRLDRALHRFTGRPMTAATGAAAVDALHAAYRRSDLALYVAGVSELGADGVLRLQALEGWVEGVDVTGPRRARTAARAYAVRLLRERPLKRSSLERATLLIQRLPGTTAVLALAPTAQPGVVRLSVRLKVRRVTAGLSLNDRGPRSLGRVQAQGELRFVNAFAPADQLVVGVAAPIDGRSVRVGGLVYARPVGALGSSVQASLGRVETRPRGTPVISRAITFSASASHPLVLRADRRVTLTATFDGQQGATSLGPWPIFDERLRTVRLGASLEQVIGAGSVNANASVGVGLSGLGAREAFPGYAPKDFTKLLLQGALASPQGPWTARLKAVGQVAGSRLPQAEQLLLGGDYGRSVRTGVLQGDDGLAASAELARTLRRVPKLVAGSEVYGFLDGGAVRMRARPVMGLEGWAGGLVTAGAGVRVAVAQHAVLEASLDRALLLDTPFGDRRRGWRLGFAVRAAY